MDNNLENFDSELQAPDNTEFQKEDSSTQHDVLDESFSIPLRIIKNFSTVWFTICMDTGVLSVILHQFPYLSHWTRVCASILFVLDVILFLAFGTIYVLRWTLFYTWTSKHIGGDSEEITLQACPAISWLTIVTLVQLICAESWGYGFTILAYVMWWIGLIWVMSICVILYLHLVKNPSRALVDKWLPTAVFIPIVGMLSVENTAGSIVNSAINDTHLGDRVAVPMIIIGFICVGFGLSLGFVMYSVYMHRLMVSGWPAPLKIPCMILTVGPCGQSASALLQLGSATVFHQNFAHYAHGFFFTESAAETIRVMCVVLALLLLGFAIFWMCVDYYAITDGLCRQEIHPSLFWWSSIFPVGTVVTAVASLGNAMDSPAFKVLAIILFVFLFCIYVVNACFTIPMTLSGELLGLPKRKIWSTRGMKHEHSWARFPRKARMS